MNRIELGKKLEEESTRAWEEDQRRSWEEATGRKIQSEQEVYDDYRSGIRDAMIKSKEDGTQSREGWIHFNNTLVGKDISIARRNMGDFSFDHISNIKEDPVTINIRQIVAEEIDNVYGAE